MNKTATLALVSGILALVGSTACTADTGSDDSAGVEEPGEQTVDEADDNETGTTESALSRGAGLTKGGPSAVVAKSLNAPNTFIQLKRSSDNEVVVSAAMPLLRYGAIARLTTKVEFVCEKAVRHSSYCPDFNGNLYPCNETKIEKTKLSSTYVEWPVGQLFGRLGFRPLKCPSGSLVEAWEVSTK